MGVGLEKVGKIEVEIRRKSFIVYYDDADERDVPPEYLIADMDDLRAALAAAREWVDQH